MGELSIEEKAKRYDKAIERAKAMIKVAANQDESIGFTNTIFPELKESEDERIRKALITFFKRFPYDSIEQAGTNAKEAIAWLEKQGEYEYTLKSSNTEDVYKLMEYITKLAKAYELNFPNRSYDIYAFAKDILAWLEKQKPVETVNRDKIKQGILRGSAINLIAWIDYNAAEGNMCLSNMECKDIEEAIVNGDWGKIYAYIEKKIEKQEPIAFNWSTDDKNKLLIIEQILDCAGLLINSHELTEIKNWLKSLKQRIGG